MQPTNLACVFLFGSLLAVSTLCAASAPERENIHAVEDSTGKCTVARLPEYGKLPEISALPDPFLALDGSRIEHKKDWNCRRAEIGAQFQKYELGKKPPKPEKVDGKVKDDQLIVSVQHKGKSVNFTADIIYPATGEPPYPAMIGMGKSWLNNEALSELGVAIINFPNNEIGEQLNRQSRGKGKFFELYGEDHSASAMMAWAWGVSRLIDALEQTPASNINTERLGITGCSRNGKGALVAGAFDERIALTIPQESGSGGAASWRISDAQKATGQNVQTLSQIVTENVWLRESFSQFSSTATKLPVDHHELMGMIAPRSLLVIENTSMEWLGNLSTYTTARAAHKIWQALGIDDHMGVSQVGGHKHCEYPDKQLPELKAHVARFLVGNNGGDTNVIKTDGDFAPDLQRWAPWSVPNLK